MRTRSSRMILAAAAFILAGCGAQSSPRASRTDSGTVVASAPREIEEITNQKKIWECPQCGMDYDAPGQCTMDHSKLVETKVDYICPADNQPVEKAGKCPRCAASVRVVKTAVAMAEPAPSAPSHN